MITRTEQAEILVSLDLEIDSAKQKANSFQIRTGEVSLFFTDHQKALQQARDIISKLPAND